MQVAPDGSGTARDNGLSPAESELRPRHRSRQREGRLGQVDAGHAHRRRPAQGRLPGRLHRYRQPPAFAHPLPREPRPLGPAERRGARTAEPFLGQAGRGRAHPRRGGERIRPFHRDRRPAGRDRGFRRHRHAGQQFLSHAVEPRPGRYAGHAGQRQFRRSRRARPRRGRAASPSPPSASMPAWSRRCAASG